jgi:hypothetical protein
MHFEYYTEKTVSQCMLALNERLHQRGGKLEGWVEKGGRFALAYTSSVMKRFSRTTRLTGQAEKGSGITIVRGFVPDGADPRSRATIYGILVLIGVFLVLSGNTLFGLIAIASPLPLNIPLEGNYNNSQHLINEVQRTLKARPTLPPSLRKAMEAKKASNSGSRATYR